MACSTIQLARSTAERTPPQVYPVTATGMILLKPGAPAYQIYLPNQGSLGVRHLAASIDFAPATLMSTGSIAHPLLPEIQQSGESLGETHRPAGVRSARGAAHRADLGRGMELPCRLREFSRRGGARDGGALRLVRWLVRAAGGGCPPARSALRPRPRKRKRPSPRRGMWVLAKCRKVRCRSSFRSATRK